MTMVSHNMTQRVHRYDSFDDKIKDYHVRKLRWHQESKNENSSDKFLGKYNTLIKARKDIKDKISNIIESALLFSDIVQWGCLPNKDYNYPPYNMLDEDRKLSKYPKQLNKDKEVRKEIEEENKEFLKEIFSEDILSRIIKSIFYGSYSENDEFDKAHRVRIAKMLITRATLELQQYMDPEFSSLYGNDLMKANTVARMIMRQQTK